VRLVLELPREQRARRFLQLVVGLLLFGFSVALMVEAHLGLDPWDVFHQGAAERTGIAIGTATIVVSVFVLLLWIPLKQLPGVGTLANAVLVGLAMNWSLALLDRPQTMTVRIAFLVAGIVLNGVATGLYIGAGLGAGPRDGLMMGLAARGHSIRVVRTGLEIGVLAAGWLLGGTVGVGTVAYAVTIGPLAHVFIPLFETRKTGPVLDV